MIHSYGNLKKGVSAVFDLLFSRTENTTSCTALDDLLFRELQDTVFYDQNDLYESFIKVVSFPLIDKEAITKRQDILKDLLDAPFLIDSMCEICGKAKDIKPEGRRSLYQKIDARARLQINYQALHNIYCYLDDLGSLLRGIRFRSAELNKIKEYFGQVNDFMILFNDLSMLTQRALEMNSYSAEVEFNKIAGFKTMKLTGFDQDDLNIKKCDEKKEMIFKKKRINDAGTILDYSKNKDIERSIEEITEKTVYNVCKLLSGVYNFYRSIFDSLYEQLIFYKAALLYLGYLKDTGQGYCFPELTCEKKCIEASGLYFFPLVLNKENVETNDFRTQGDSIFIISGYNRAGKTTFLRSIGFAQILAQSGLVVPANSYKCSVFSYILVHFPRGEEKQLLSGLFEDEMKRLKNDIDRIKSDSLVLLNESFSTTVESEAESHASNIITALAWTGSVIFFVTHFYNFSVHIEDLNRRLDGKSSAVNLVTEKYEKPNTRSSYRIVRGKPVSNYKIKLEDFL